MAAADDRDSDVRVRPWDKAAAVRIGNAREGALIDLTGQWVSVITEDWRWRMVTPPKGDTASVPLNPAGRKVADAWDLDRGSRARPPVQGVRAAGIDSPARTRCASDGRTTPRCVLEFDAGTQTRRFHFGRTRPAGARTAARAFRRRGGSGSRRIAGSSAAAAPARGGSLEVVTTNLTAGYLRPNGVPYSERAVVKEFFDSFTLPEDGTWLIVTTVVRTLNT